MKAKLFRNFMLFRTHLCGPVRNFHYTMFYVVTALLLPAAIQKFTARANKQFFFEQNIAQPKLLFIKTNFTKITK